VKDRSAIIENALERLKVDRFDEHAWSDLYDVIVPRARAIAFRLLVGDGTSSQDAVHDALLRLMRYSTFDRFGSSEEFLKYFTMIVHRAALDIRRRQHAEPTTMNAMADKDVDVSISDFDLEGGSESSGQTNDPESQLSFKRAVENLSNSLSARELLVCTLLAGGYERHELAARLGTSEPTAAVIIYRLRVKLRELSPLP
jgi:RNA polymerase sigma factor (sigma-70 family)